MKIILGDNQFLGVNHFDLNKGEKTKLKFDTENAINVLEDRILRLALTAFFVPIRSSNRKFKLNCTLF